MICNLLKLMHNANSIVLAATKIQKRAANARGEHIFFSVIGDDGETQRCTILCRKCWRGLFEAV